jgi:2-phosphosulfolactate phosphatase
VLYSHNQSQYEIRCEWGENGVKQLAPISDVVIIVDVMSFSTCVSIAVSQGAFVFPFLLDRVKAAEYAVSIGAVSAQARAGGLYSLSPQTMLQLQPSMKIVLPSGNGARLTLLSGSTTCLAGSLRNAKATAHKAQKLGTKIAVIPAGERWLSDDSLRPALEDWIGAGAIISHLTGKKSPEAISAEKAFMAVSDNLTKALTECSSGQELVYSGYLDDILSIAALDADHVAPVLKDGYYSS